MKKYIIALMCLCSVGLLADVGLMEYDGKIYIDDADLQSSDESFHIHLGGNMWVQTETINRDTTGLYTYSHCLVRNHKAIEKKWKCPYCFQYWPVGSPCKNEYCPSRYKTVSGPRSASHDDVKGANGPDEPKY